MPKTYRAKDYRASSNACLTFCRIISLRWINAAFFLFRAPAPAAKPANITPDEAITIASSDAKAVQMYLNNAVVAASPPPYAANTIAKT